MALEIEEILSQGEKIVNTERGEQRYEILGNINRKVVLVARELIMRKGEKPEVSEAMKEVIRDAEKKICILVKNHCESDRVCVVEVSEEVYKGEHIGYFEKKMEINGFFITLKFNDNSDGRWKYTISCKNLEINDLVPPQDLVIQGQLEVRFFCSGNLRKQRIRLS